MNDTALLTQLKQSNLTPPSSTIQCIKEHLTHLLYTPKGSTPLSTQYGLTPLSQLDPLTPEKSIQTLQHDLQRTIIKHEPRISLVTLTLLNSNHSIDFDLHAKLTLKPEITLQLTIKFYPTGAIHIHEQQNT